MRVVGRPSSSPGPTRGKGTILPKLPFRDCREENAPKHFEEMKQSYGIQQVDVEGKGSWVLSLIYLLGFGATPNGALGLLPARRSEVDPGRFRSYALHAVDPG